MNNTSIHLVSECEWVWFIYIWTRKRTLPSIPIRHRIILHVSCKALFWIYLFEFFHYFENSPIPLQLAKQLLRSQTVNVRVISVLIFPRHKEISESIYILFIHITFECCMCLCLLPLCCVRSGDGTNCENKKPWKRRKIIAEKHFAFAYSVRYKIQCSASTPSCCKWIQTSPMMIVEWWWSGSSSNVRSFVWLGIGADCVSESMLRHFI